MSDYRNRDDSLQRATRYDADVRSTNAAWGWIAGAVFLVIVLAIVFGIGHTSNRTGKNKLANITPPAATQTEPAPSGPANLVSPAPLHPTQPAPQPRP
jgi:hypothetical protein